MSRSSIWNGSCIACIRTAVGTVEQGYRQVQQGLGRADWQVRSDRAIHRLWGLVDCAFAFCWWAWKRAPTVLAVPTGTTPETQPTTVTEAGWGTLWPASVLGADPPTVLGR